MEIEARIGTSWLKLLILWAKNSGSARKLIANWKIIKGHQISILSKLIRTSLELNDRNWVLKHFEN